MMLKWTTAMANWIQKIVFLGSWRHWYMPPSRYTFSVGAKIQMTIFKIKEISFSKYYETYENILK